MNRLVTLVASGTPEAIGSAHGSAFASEIRSYTEDRVQLSRTGTDLDRAGIVAIAHAMLDAHRAYDEDLFLEMVAMADAVGISPAEAVIVGGYTDFIDTVRRVAHGSAVEDTCTAVITPDARSDGHGFLAQTWDMHASATPHVFMFDVQPDEAPRTLVFTTHGTLGQIGMNEAGIAVGINNLTMTDGALGVTWPFVVRKALAATTFDAAIAAILDAPLAGGHNFLVLDRQGRGASIEATPSASHVDVLEGEALIHTNHCLAPTTQAVEAARPAELERSSATRLDDAAAALDHEGPYTLDEMKELLRDERSICRRPEPPFDYESSGAMIMRPGTRDVWACWGVPSDNDFEHFSLDDR